MEITITEFVLFCWAAGATIYAFMLSEQIAASKQFLLALIDNPDMYKELSQSLANLREKADANRV